MNERMNAIISTMITVILMSSAVVAAKYAFSSVTPATFLWMTTVIGMIVMVVYTFVLKKEKIPWNLMTKKVWTYLFLIGFFNFVTGQFTTLSLNYLPATTNTYLSKFVGFITLFFSIIILKEVPGLFQFLGAGIALIGLRIFFAVRLHEGELIGVILILIGITGLAYTNNITRKLAIETNNQISNNIISTLAILIGGSIMSVICMLIDGLPPKLTNATDVLLIIFVGVGVKAIALSLWNKNLRVLRSYEVSLMGASMVIWTSIMAWLFIGETLNQNQMLGIGFLLVGLILVQFRHNPRIKGLRKPLVLQKFLIKRNGSSEP